MNVCVSVIISASRERKLLEHHRGIQEADIGQEAPYRRAEDDPPTSRLHSSVLADEVGDVG